MGGVRFGGCIGLFFLALAAVAPLAITSDAADGRRHRDVHVQNVHHSGLVTSRPRHVASSCPRGSPHGSATGGGAEHHHRRCSRAGCGRHFHQTSANCGRTRQT